MKKFFAILAIAVHVCGILMPIPALAGTSSLFLTPSSTTQNVGNNFTVYLGVNANGNAVNAFQATVNLPSSVVAINSASTEGSMCSIWVKQPTVSGSTVSFSCGVPGGTTASGNLIAISLKANAIGSATATISGAKVLAGPGTDVTGGTSGATINVVAAPNGTTSGSSPGSGAAASQTTIGPKVSSSSHPDQNAWYKNRDINLSWTRDGGVTGYSYLFDQSPGSVPRTVVNSTSNSISFSGKSDGVWYFHIRANSSKGWGNTAHFKIQVDSTSPKNIVLSIDPSNVSDRRPTITFSASDDTSGINYYEIRLDNWNFKRTTSPFTPEKITSGDHIYTVRAYDRAGNIAEGSAKFTIKEILAPKITTPAGGTTLKLMKELVIKGAAPPSTKIELYLDGNSIASGIVVNQNGNWEYIYKNIVLPGSHKLSAVAISDGIESKSSEVIDFRIDPSAIRILGKDLPSNLIFIILISIIFILIIVIGFLARSGRERIQSGLRKVYRKIRPIHPNKS